MPRRFMPYVESPMIGVFTMMPGLSADEMEIYVTKPIDTRALPGLIAQHLARAAAR